jgi:hypothetical protein
MAKVERITERIKRQRSWEAWQASKMLAAASGQMPQRLGGAEQQQQQAEAKVQGQAGAAAAPAAE